MKITKRQLKRIIREEYTRILSEYNDQDYQNEVEAIVDIFYDVATEYEQYMPVSLEMLSDDQINLVFEFQPPEFMGLDQMDSSAMLELNPEKQKEVNDWLMSADWYEGDDLL
tara:strand:- start:2362 stop:2697 length:336 start_codon:yes stop_codon:yes gene_type:complete